MREGDIRYIYILITFYFLAYIGLQSRIHFVSPICLNSGFNEAVFAKLKMRGTTNTFSVGTYHMPCLFGHLVQVQPTFWEDSRISIRLDMQGGHVNFHDFGAKELQRKFEQSIFIAACCWQGALLFSACPSCNVFCLCRLAKFAQGTPVALMGDFNIQPGQTEHWSIQQQQTNKLQVLEALLHTNWLRMVVLQKESKRRPAPWSFPLYT